MDTKIFDVKFKAYSENHTDDYLFLEGVLTVNATDIFDALDKASKRIKQFGFPRSSLDGATVLEPPKEEAAT